MRKIVIAFAGVAMAWSMPAWAQVLPGGLSSDYLACNARARGSVVQEGFCTQKELVAQDARLNKAYQQVMRQLASDPAGRQNLQRVEQAWLKRRDYVCQIDGHTINSSCLVAQTATRANELESQIRF